LLAQGVFKLFTRRGHREPSLISSLKGSPTEKEGAGNSSICTFCPQQEKKGGEKVY